MNVFLDRNLCNRRAGCESCFSIHLLNSDFDEATCALDVVETQRPEVVFRIHDRDDSIKTLVVNDENKNQALASWIWLWEQQAGPVI